MPDPARFIFQIIQRITEQRANKFIAPVKEQRDAFRVLRVERKIIGLFLLDPRRAQPEWRACFCRPGPHEFSFKNRRTAFAIISSSSVGMTPTLTRPPAQEITLD